MLAKKPNPPPPPLPQITSTSVKLMSAQRTFHPSHTLATIFKQLHMLELPAVSRENGAPLVQFANETECYKKHHKIHTSVNTTYCRHSDISIPKLKRTWCVVCLANFHTKYASLSLAKFSPEPHKHHQHHHHRDVSYPLNTSTAALVHHCLRNAHFVCTALSLSLSLCTHFCPSLAPADCAFVSIKCFSVLFDKTIPQRVVRGLLFRNSSTS